MLPVRRLSLGSIGVAALTLSMLLSGCGAGSTTTSGQRAVIRTATAVATRTPTPTQAPYVAGQSAGCPSVASQPVPPQYRTVAGLKISIPQRWADYPNEAMPSNAPNAPYQVPLTASEATQPGVFQPHPPVNPSLATGYGIQICNQTSESHTITSLSVSIASFVPSSGPVTIWHLCGDGPYNAATKQTTTGCGGGMGDVNWLTATFSSDSTGATAPAIGKGVPYGETPPFVIKPNTSRQVLIAVNGLTSQGTYALTFGMSVDGAAPTMVDPSDGSFLIAPAAVVWTGTACRSPAMQAQIPAATQDTYYVCPPAS